MAETKNISGGVEPWPAGSLGYLYDEQLERLNTWHFEIDAAKMGVAEAEKKIGVDVTFAGDLPFEGYQFLAGARYYPPYFTVNLPYQLQFGIGKKNSWGDLRVFAFGQIPSLTSTENFEDNWRTGILVQPIWVPLETRSFRFGLFGEAGISVGKPGEVTSHLGAGIMIGVKR